MEIILGILLLCLYVYLIILFFQYVFPWLSLIGAVGASGWAVYNFFVAAKECWEGKLPTTTSYGPVGPEPAFKQYFFRKAFLDLRDIIIDNVKRNVEAIKISAEGAKVVLLPPPDNEPGMLIFTWPLAVVFATVGLIGIAGAVAINAAFATGFALAMGVCVAGNAGLAGAVLLVEKVILATRKFVNHCPRCFERFTLPVYECPNPACRARHQKLIPGSYGIFRRKCKCEKELLPTLYLVNRHKLESFCPNCDHRLEEEDPTLRPALVPVIGGRSAGKTSFQVGLLQCLQEREKRNECRISFVNADDKQQYDDAIAMFQQGRLLPQTLERVPKALQLNLISGGALTTGAKNSSRLRLHLYDAAGEAYEDEHNLSQLTFLQHCSGIILLIDPFSIETVREQFHRELASEPADAGASDADPDEVYSRLMEFLEQHKVRVRAGSIKFPLAVVVTKRDAFGLGKHIGQSAFHHWQQVENQRAKQENRPPEHVTASSVVRKWLLAQNLAGVINKIESQFENCRYFSCSAFGRPPSQLEGAPFTPLGIDQPFLWILNAMDQPSGLSKLTKRKATPSDDV